MVLNLEVNPPFQESLIKIFFKTTPPLLEIAGGAEKEVLDVFRTNTLHPRCKVNIMCVRQCLTYWVG